MPEEVFIIVALAIASGTFLGFVRAVLRYLTNKNQPARSADGAQLTTRELHRLIEDAVEAANAPLWARLEALEDPLRLEAPPPAAPLQTEARLGDDALEGLASSPARRRVH